jgi:hypothetical protein
MLLTPNGRFELNTKVGSLDLFPESGPLTLHLIIRFVSASQTVRVLLYRLPLIQID